MNTLIKRVIGLRGKTLVLIFLIALVLRFAFLSSFPVGVHSDEVKVAWNSYSILKTGLDDHGHKWALYYDTFGDFRPTGIFYFTIPSLFIFGNTELGIRSPAALFGALTIFPLYFFVIEILRKKTGKYKENVRIAQISALMLAISPWHIEVSRATSEMAISVFFALYGLYFLVKLIRGGRLIYLLLLGGFFVISYLLYHAIRFLAPFFLITLIVLFYKELKNFKKIKLVALALIFVFILTAFFSSTPEAKRRFEQVSIFSDDDSQYEIGRLKTENENKFVPGFVFDNKYVVYLRRFLNEYPSYFSGSFLTGNVARPYRYSIPGAGLLTYAEFALFILGVFEVIKRRRLFLPLALLLIAPLPAALTTEDAPNLHRAFFMVPFLMIIEAYGLQFLLKLKKFKFIKPLTIFSLVIGFGYFLHMYFFHAFYHKPFLKDYNLDGSSYRNVGAKELALKLKTLRQNYDKIIISNTPDDFYPWYAFFNNEDPSEFNHFAQQRGDGQWQYKNIVFSDMKCPSTSVFKTEKIDKLLVIDAGDPICAYNSALNDGLKARVVEKILRVNGSEVYVLLERI